MSDIRPFNQRKPHLEADWKPRRRMTLEEKFPHLTEAAKESKTRDYAEQAKGVFHRGQYVITRDDGGNLYSVARIDGSPVPEKLQGRFTNIRAVELILATLSE